MAGRSAAAGAALSIAYGSDPPSPAMSGSTVLAWYDVQVRERPTSPAIDNGSQVWSYAELDAAATRIAGALAGRLGAGQFAAVCCGLSGTLVAVAVAAAKLGATYLSFGPRPGGQRLQETVRQLGITCLIHPTQMDLPSGLSRAQIPLPALGRDQQMVASVTGQPGPDGRSPIRRSLYSVLTSGSTGQPKAVLVGGESLATLLAWCRPRFQLGPGDRVSMLLAPGFDVHLFDLWAPLCHGATLCVPPAGTGQDPAWVLEWWQQAQVTVSVLPTPVAELVLERPWPARLALRHLIIGGDRLRRWPAAEVTAAVHNAYGPAEATMFCVTCRLDAPGALAGNVADPPPIGRPVGGTTVVVADTAGKPVPRGQPGELLVGGACLSLGYLDPELTAQRFVAAPGAVARNSGPGLVYRTGDRVLMRPDGVLEFLGRLDDQVKVSGVRVEPAEVEAALERHPQVRQAVVAPSRTPAGIRLVAFVRPAQGAAPDPAEVLEHTRSWLVDQAVPAEVHLVPEFPLTTNGKVDRASLLNLCLRCDQAPADVPDARPGAEEAVLRMCRHLLDQPALSIRQSFTSGGGNSVAAAQLLTAIEAEFGIRLRAVDVLRQPDLRALAGLIESRGESAPKGRP